MLHVARFSFFKICFHLLCLFSFIFILYGLDIFKPSNLSYSDVKFCGFICFFFKSSLILKVFFCFVLTHFTLF